MEMGFNKDVIDETVREAYAEEELRRRMVRKKSSSSTGFMVGLIFGIALSFSFSIIANASALENLWNWGINTFMPGWHDNAGSDDTEDTSAQSDVAKLNMKTVENKLKTLQSIVSKNYLFEADAAALENGIYKGYIDGLGDIYSVYYTEEEFTALMEDTEGVYFGIGARVQKDPNTGIISLVTVFPGSPAEEAGLQANDILYKVDGIEVAGMDLDILIQQHIKGAEFTKVKITVLRGDAMEELEFEVERRSIEVPTVDHKMLDGQVGYVMVNQFDSITSAQFQTAIEDLQAQGMEKLVIDLRNNPGGVLDGTIEMLDYLLPDGLLAYTADKNGKGERFYSEDGHEVDVPMSVLINGNSASASELFAGAVKDFEWGSVVGTTSFGKGIVQNLIPLIDGSAIRLTTQHYYTQSGQEIHGNGIEPDVVVELNEGATLGGEDDNQLQEAIRLAK